MAEQPLTLVGDVLIELLNEGLSRLKPAAKSALETLRQASVPPAGVSFSSEDGASYTGVAVLDANRVVLLLAARSEPSILVRSERHERQERPPLITPPPSPQRPYYGSQRSFYEREREPEDEEPDWGEHSGYSRYK